jgi:hypothetical protein
MCNYFALPEYTVFSRFLKFCGALIVLLAESAESAQKFDLDL